MAPVFELFFGCGVAEAVIVTAARVEVAASAVGCVDRPDDDLDFVRVLTFEEDSELADCVGFAEVTAADAGSFLWATPFTMNTPLPS